jgi:thiosulfate/3-mercaptopyruvate sulfurtransferase
MIRLVAIFLFLLLALPARALDVPSTMVDAAWLKANLGAPGLRVIEVSSRVSYEFDGHVPGAALTTKGEWRIDEADGAYVHRPVAEVQAMLRALGVNDGDAVVVYGKGDTRDDLLGAAYLVWLLHYLGQANAALLDQTWSGWLAVDGPVETEAPATAPGTFTARPVASLEISTDDLLAVYRGATVIDARPAGHYAGRTKFPANPKYGRIPGTLSMPWPDNIGTDLDGRLFLSSATPALISGGGLARDEPLIITCFGGTGAAIAYVLLRHHGYDKLRVHDAGLRRWNARDLPLVQGR